MTFTVTWTPTGRKALRLLPEKVGPAVLELIYGPLADDPYRVGKRLRFELEGHYSARRGDYRVIYQIDDALERVVIEFVAHRGQAYRPR